jgi:hypothetical protein
MRVPLMAWYPPPAVPPETPLVPDLAVGAWFGLALLTSLAFLLWGVARSRGLRSQLPRRARRPRPRSIGRGHAVPGRP